jgi:hypothetical protein
MRWCFPGLEHFFCIEFLKDIFVVDSHKCQIINKLRKILLVDERSDGNIIVHNM